MNRTPTSLVSRSGQLRRRVERFVRTPRGVALIVVLLFVVFEVGIRHIPPDGMTVTKMGYSGATYALFYTAPKDQQTISETYATLHAAPAVSPFAHYNCALAPSPYSVAFTWHGVPVEAWFTGGCMVSDTAGGIPDLTGHLLYLGALPPPASK